jgi:hypothetical protein
MLGWGGGGAGTYAQEPHIDEYYCGAFLPDGRHVVAGGKLKDRGRWSAEDDDNHILPCPLKVRGAKGRGKGSEPVWLTRFRIACSCLM